ncbi:Membrane protein of ER body 1 [Camellia lanceoleosa]|uniref:Membrane protein of ER body 1 n=1 Tax=Camellia lanceoleosa TaxID=1840588 RepID=A0ACC0G3E9_9ERIC|nr:Membrane protein of ER body 1 [Camellia lanceoleosa]
MDVLLHPERQTNTTKDLKDMPAKTSAGSDTIIIIKEGPVEPAEPHEAQDIVASAEIGPSPHTEITEARGFQGLDVIRSIVYGGLIESITSLGIVSSAAGADAATLGDLIKELLEKHGFNSGDLALTLPILEATSKQPAWESY